MIIERGLIEREKRKRDFLKSLNEKSEYDRSLSKKKDADRKRFCRRNRSDSDAEHQNNLDAERMRNVRSNMYFIFVCY